MQTIPLSFYKYIEQNLKAFRDGAEITNATMKQRLLMAPCAYRDLFRLKDFEIPCKLFGRNFVLKIIDELIYCELNKKGTI